MIIEQQHKRRKNLFYFSSCVFVKVASTCTKLATWREKKKYLHYATFDECTSSSSCTFATFFSLFPFLLQTLVRHSPPTYENKKRKPAATLTCRTTPTSCWWIVFVKELLSCCLLTKYWNKVHRVSRKAYYNAHKMCSWRFIEWCNKCFEE